MKELHPYLKGQGHTFNLICNHSCPGCNSLVHWCKYMYWSVLKISASRNKGILMKKAFGAFVTVWWQLMFFMQAFCYLLLYLPFLHVCLAWNPFYLPWKKTPENSNFWYLEHKIYFVFLTYLCCLFAIFITYIAWKDVALSWVKSTCS